MADIEKSRIKQINKWHNEILGFGAQALERAMLSGEALMEIKRKVGWGSYESWIKENLTYDERTARRYVSIYEYRKRLKTDSVSDLTSAYRLIANIRELDKVAKEYGVSSHTKAKVSKILPNIDRDDVELHVNLNIPRKEKELRAEKQADKEQGRYIENRVKEIHSDLVSLTSKISRLKEHLESVKLEQIVGWGVRDLLRAIKRFNATYDKLRPFLDDSIETEQLKKQVDSIETRFPRKELPAIIQNN